MVRINFAILAIATLVPLITGFIWYHPKVMGTAWMKASGVDAEKMKKGNMALIFGLVLVLSFLIALVMNMIVVHQVHLYSIVANEPSLQDPNSELSQWIKAFLGKYGNNFRTFKHGAFHGTMTALLFVLPILSIIALFERRSFKYVAIHTGYWILTLALMGGLVCAFP